MIGHTASQSQARRRRRSTTIVSGVVSLGVIVVLLITGSGGGISLASTTPHSTVDHQAQQRVDSLLAAIRQPIGTDAVLGNPKAKVKITEYGDLECFVCDQLNSPHGWRSPDAKSEGYRGSGIVDQIIRRDVRTGKAKFVYRSLETSTGSDESPGMWVPQQSAVNAAALQGKGWQFLELFYMEQGPESKHYVTRDFIEGIAKQVRGLNYRRWHHAWTSDEAVARQVKSDNRAGTKLDRPTGIVATPTVLVKGSKHRWLFIGDVTVAKVSRAVRSNL
jgi:protein-disulfide isomerase